MAKCVQCGRQMPPLSFGRKVCQWCRRYEAAQRGEEQEYQPVMPQPWARRRSADPVVMYVLVGLNVAVFVGMALAGVSPANPTVPELIHWGANFGPLTLSGQWWRLVSAMFLHIGFLHIAFNMWCLWDLGTLAETLYGRWTFLSIYMITGVASSLTSLWWHPRSVSAGASGAIFGITGALIASLKLGEFSLPSAAIQGVMRSVLVFAGYNLVFGAISSRTDNAAHIGGLVTGLVMGAAVAKLAPVSSARRFTVIVLIALLVLGGGAYLFSANGSMSRMARAQQLEEDGKHGDAIAELTKAVSAQPDDVHARLMLGLAYARNNQLSEAEREFKELLQRHPESTVGRYELGLVYLGMERPDQAASEFNKLLSADGDNAQARIGLGLALAQGKNDAGAVAEFNKAISVEPNAPEGYYHLGQSYIRLRQYDDAIAALKKAAEKGGDDSDTELALARAYSGKGMKQEAADAASKARALQNKEKSQNQE